MGGSSAYQGQRGETGNGGAGQGPLARANEWIRYLDAAGRLERKCPVWMSGQDPFRDGVEENRKGGRGGSIRLDDGHKGEVKTKKPVAPGICSEATLLHAWESRISGDAGLIKRVGQASFRR